MTDLIIDTARVRSPVVADSFQATGRRRGAASRLSKFCLGHPLALLGTALPTLVVATYHLFIAAPIFVSESKFVVRLSSPPSQSTIGAMLQSSGITRSQDDTFSVSDFLLSRDALRRLSNQLPVKEIFGAMAGDYFARYPRFWENDSFEGLFRHYLSRVDVAHNSSTGVTTLRTRAFSPQYAFNMNEDLLAAASDLLVKLNNRARVDAVASSRREVADLEARLLDVQGEITKFRNNELTIDPTRSSMVMLDMIGRLATELALTRARRAEAVSSAPGSVTIPGFDGRIAALEDQIDRERAKLVGTDASISMHIAEYERLTLKRELASKALSSASAALETARTDAQRQQLYLEPIVQPNYPDVAIEPTGATYVLVTFLVGAIGSMIIWLLWTAAAEHSRNRNLLQRAESIHD